MTSAIEETRSLWKRLRHKALENYMQGGPETQYFFTPGSRSRCRWTRVTISEDVTYRFNSGEPVQEKNGGFKAVVNPVPFQGW